MGDAQVLNKPTISNQWFMKVKLKQHLSECTKRTTIAEKSLIFFNEISRSAENVGASKLLQAHEAESMQDTLNELAGEFQFLQHLADGTINDSEWSDLSFDGDFLSMFNDNMNALYDVAARRVLTKRNCFLKFLWIQ